MKAIVVLVDRDRTDAGAEQVRLLLKDGSWAKFILMVRVDLEKEEFYLVLAIGNESQHKYLVNPALKDHRVKHLLGVGDCAPRGGGSIQMDDGKLIFFDISGSFGKYDEGLIRRVSDQLLEIFGASEIELR